MFHVSVSNPPSLDTSVQDIPLFSMKILIPYLYSGKNSYDNYQGGCKRKILHIRKTLFSYLPFITTHSVGKIEYIITADSHIYSMVIYTTHKIKDTVWFKTCTPLEISSCSARDWDGKDYLRIIPRVVW